jgi:hypothetical protein
MSHQLCWCSSSPQIPSWFLSHIHASVHACGSNWYSLYLSPVHPGWHFSLVLLYFKNLCPSPLESFSHCIAISYYIFLL